MANGRLLTFTREERPSNIEEELNTIRGLIPHSNEVSSTHVFYRSRSVGIIIRSNTSEVITEFENSVEEIMQNQGYQQIDRRYL